MIRPARRLLHACVAIAIASSSLPLAIAQRNTETLTSADDPKSRLTQTELAALTNAFADRYMTYIVQATDEIERNNPNIEQRRRAHQVKLVQTSAIYDIVTNADPFTQLLDLTMVVSLQARKWIDDDQAERWFGARGRPLVIASRNAREDIWRIAARAMKPEQLEQLDGVILAWHRENPQIEIVSWVRFDEFAAARGKSILSDVAAGGGLLAPVGEATKAVDEVRLLAERAFYLGKRWPFLLSWQARAAVDDALSVPALTDIQAAIPQLVQSIDRATKTVERLPRDIGNEREQLTATFNQTHPKVLATLSSANSLVRDANTLGTTALSLSQALGDLLARIDEASTTLVGTIRTVDDVLMKPGRDKPPDPNAKPFDIAQYATTAVETTRALKEANLAIEQLRTTIDSPQLGALVDRPIERVSQETRRLIDVAFWRAVALLVIAFVLALVYRLISARLGAPGRA